MNTYRPHQFAALVGVHVKTLQRWDREGRLVPARTISGHRFYTDADLRSLRGLPDAKKRIIAYCRVSSSAQKPDLGNQRKILEELCAAKGFDGAEFIEEIGGGLNFKRPKFGTYIRA